MVEQCWWNSVVEQWNSDGGTVLVEQCWWNRVVERCDSEGGTVCWNCNSGIVMVEQCWWNSGTVMVKQWNSSGRTVEQDRGTVEE